MGQTIELSLNPTDLEMVKGIYTPNKMNTNPRQPLLDFGVLIRKPVLEPIQ